MIKTIALSLLLLSNLALAKQDNIVFTQQPIPKSIRQEMLNVTWKYNCPVPLDNLSLLQITYWGFDNQIHHGQLIVHQQAANETLAIFHALLDQKYPIERMELMFRYQGDDQKSMENNNTSAFNCRPITGNAHRFSKHSYGKAIDINTKINPYVKNDSVLPKNALSYVDRKQQLPGMIHKDDNVYQLFQKNHWHWGGDWHSLKDYQHFEKEIPND